MVKDKAEVAAERQAQRKALREAMKAGRQQHMQNDDQNIQTSPAIDSGALPAPPSEPLPLTPLEEEASKHCHNIPSPPAFPLPELPPLSFQKEPHGSPEVERPASACSTASRASSGTSVEFSAWACASSPRFRLSSSHGDQDDDAASSDSSILDLEQSLHDAAEKSGILSDNEEGSDESRLRSSQIRTGASNSTLDLLDTVAVSLATTHLPTERNLT